MNTSGRIIFKNKLFINQPPKKYDCQQRKMNATPLSKAGLVYPKSQS